MLTLRGSREDVEMQVVLHFVDAVNSLFKSGKDKIIVGFPGGRSIKGILELLGSVRESLDLDWSRIVIFMVDERWVNRTHPDSNFLQLDEMLLDRLYHKGLDRKNVHAFDDSERGLEEYNKLFAKHGSGFDITFLGVGEDGHVGSLYPDHVSIKNDTSDYIEVLDSPKPPAHRMTASRSILSSTTITYLLFFGRGKQAAYQDFMNREIGVIDCPAKLALDCEVCVVATDLKEEKLI